jgi:hypothetical protein
MTLAMPDSIHPTDLPAGYPAYLGYVDGKWPTCATIRAQHPTAHHICLTVTGATIDAHGIDCEPGNPDAASSAGWVHSKLSSAPQSRPVVYASVHGSPGYGMPDVLHQLTAHGITRDKVRLLSAHYTGHAHICGPRSCGAISIDMDGTQWTDQHPGTPGTMIDMSEVSDTFFGGTVTTPPAQITAPPGTWLDAILTGRGTNGQLYVAEWNGKAWRTVLWPVQQAP